MVISISTHPWLWATFGATLAVMLAADLWLIGRGQDRTVATRQAALWSGLWVLVTAAFAAGVWFYLDRSLGRAAANDTTLQFATAYLIEKSLAVDNVFVWLVLFSSLSTPPRLQKRVLTYGVVGAIVMRTAMIFGGVWVLERFHFVLYIFGAALICVAIHLWRTADQAPNVDDSRILRWIRRHIPMRQDINSDRFFVKERSFSGTRWLATPLFVAVVMIECIDLIFAADSIPAVFAITTDPFIVVTSNLFALLGLRAMYFLVVDLAHRFTLLKYGLAVIMMFVGAKLLLSGVIKIPSIVSLVVIVSTLGIAMLLSVRRRASVPGSPLQLAGSQAPVPNPSTLPRGPL